MQDAREKERFQLYKSDRPYTSVLPFRVLSFMSCEPLPTAAEVQITRARITFQHKAIRDAEQQIEELVKQLDALRDKVSRIREEIAANEAFIAPVRRLPFEVLAEIIVTLATDPSAEPQVLRTLSSVCKAWRDTTLRTPRAWSKIVFKYDRRIYARSHAQLRSLRDLREWFARSGSCRKDVSLTFWGDTPSVELHALRDLVRAHASELRSVSLVTLQSHVKDCLAAPTPLLEHLDLTPFTTADETWHDALANAAPRLSSVALRNHDSYLPHAVRIRLVSLAIDAANLPKLLSRMRGDGGFPVLRALSVAKVEDFDLYDNVPPIQTHLRVLYLCLAVRATPSLFRIIRAPHLRKLALQAAAYDQATKMESFAIFDGLMTTSNPPLSELYLQRVCLWDHDLIKLLSQLPALERLVLHTASASDKVCDALAVPRHRGWICPRLTHVCIFNTPTRNESGISSDSLEKVARARYSEKNVSRLVEVRLGYATLRCAASDWEWDEYGANKGAFPDYPSMCLKGPEPIAWWQVRTGPDII